MILPPCSILRNTDTEPGARFRCFPPPSFWPCCARQDGARQKAYHAVGDHGRLSRSCCALPLFPRGQIMSSCAAKIFATCTVWGSSSWWWTMGFTLKTLWPRFSLGRAWWWCPSARLTSSTRASQVQTSRPSHGVQIRPRLRFRRRAYWKMSFDGRPYSTASYDDIDQDKRPSPPTIVVRSFLGVRCQTWIDRKDVIPCPIKVAWQAGMCCAHTFPTAPQRFFLRSLQLG